MCDATKRERARHHEVFARYLTAQMLKQEADRTPVSRLIPERLIAALTPRSPAVSTVNESKRDVDSARAVLLNPVHFLPVWMSRIGASATWNQK